MWEFETHFSSINHSDSKGQIIRIIGDFKIIFNSVYYLFINVKYNIFYYKISYTIRIIKPTRMLIIILILIFHFDWFNYAI